MILRLYLALFHLVEALRLAPFKWRHAAFRRHDRALARAYFFRSPYRVSRANAIAQGHRDLHTYGETPLSLFAEIGLRCHLGKSSIVLDLGCGRGRGLLFLHHRFGSSAIGIDWNPTFIARAEKLKTPITWQCANFLDGIPPEASLVFLNNPFLTDREISKLLPHLQTLKTGTQIVTVSFSLKECGAPSSFRLKECFTARFPWGKTGVFIHEIT